MNVSSGKTLKNGNGSHRPLKQRCSVPPSPGIHDPETQLFLSPRMVLASNESSNDHIASLKQDIKKKTLIKQ